MFPHNPLYEGGVILLGTNATFTNCLFDSTNTGIRGFSNQILRLYSSEFRDCPTRTLWVDRYTVIADETIFTDWGFYCGPNSEFRNCSFDSIQVSPVLNMSGHVVLENCLIRRHESSGMMTLEGVDVRGVIRGCRFVDCRPSSIVMGFLRDCGADLTITDNVFEDIDLSGQGAVIAGGCSDVERGGIVTIRNNRFTRCSGDLGGKCIRNSVDSSPWRIDSNFFVDDFGGGSCIQTEFPDRSMRENVFVNNAYALSSVFYCDARHNYWGDSTGPYNALHNPQGHGDNVSDSVVFNPWYPDTSFLVNAAAPQVELPTQFELRAYPNPFNSTARIELDVPAPFIGEITLTNLLGQTVRTIHRGPLYGREFFDLNAAGLSSGIYFITARDVIQRINAASTKLLLLK